jgi:hypothetical protein
MMQIAAINESTAMADGDVQRMIPAFSVGGVLLTDFVTPNRRRAGSR